MAVQIAEIVSTTWNQAAPEVEILGIGIGSPGVVDTDAGVVHLAPNLHDASGQPWRDVPIVDLVRKALGSSAPRAILLENDVNAMVLAESRYGAGRGASILVGVTLGTGVGGGIVVDGAVHRGASGTAGEIGHVTVVADGPRCGCGNDGCLEALVGTRGIERRARAAMAAGRETSLRDDLTPLRIARAAEAGDPLAGELFEETGRYVGVVLAGVANLLNPDMVVIGGGVAAAGEDLLFTHIRDEVRRRAIDTAADAMRIAPAQLGNDAGLIGCAVLALLAGGAVTYD